MDNGYGTMTMENVKNNILAKQAKCSLQLRFHCLHCHCKLTTGCCGINGIWAEDVHTVLSWPIEKAFPLTSACFDLLFLLLLLFVQNISHPFCFIFKEYDRNR